MEISLNFEKDFKRVKRELGDFGKKAVPAAANSALNKTATQTRTQVVRDLKGEMGKATGLSTSGFRKAITLKKSTRRTLLARLIATGKPLPLISFGARQGARGVHAAAWGKRKLYRHTFIATMPGGHKGVFSRVGNRRKMQKGRYTGQRRQPIQEKWGPSIPGVFLEGPIQNGMQRSVKTRWPKNFSRELRYYLRKFNG